MYDMYPSCTRGILPAGWRGSPGCERVAVLTRRPPRPRRSRPSTGWCYRRPEDQGLAADTSAIIMYLEIKLLIFSQIFF